MSYSNLKVSKRVPRQAEVAQEVPGRLKPRIFLTFWHYKGGRSSAKRTGCLYPRRNPWYALSEAESTSGHMVLSGVQRKKSPVTPPGIDLGTVRLLAQRLNHYATPGPCYFVLWPINAQLFHKLLHSYMFRHCRVILRESVVSTLLSYTSMHGTGIKIFKKWKKIN
jgi:hypothetical protein